MSLVHHLHANFVQYCKPVLNKGTKSDQIKLLDFCTGSGVQALAALAMFELLPTSDKEITNVLATAVDVNERALRFAEFNALLNGYFVKSLKKDAGVHSRIESKMELCSLHADLVTGEVQSSAKCGNHLVDELLQLGSSGEARFNFVLANPPFIPTPLKAADNRVLSIYGNEHGEAKNKVWAHLLRLV
jgi:methylase of polypeptide subunit release factors